VSKVRKNRGQAALASSAEARTGTPRRIVDARLEPRLTFEQAVQAKAGALVGVEGEMATVLGCTCCARPWERCPVEAKRVGLRGPARDPDNVCRDCMAHAGFGLQMAKEHIPLWQGYVAQVEAEAGERLAEAEGRFARAQRELAERPERIVEKYINEADMQAAKAEAQRAFQSRSYAWQNLSALGLLHAEMDGARCRCGKVRRSCSEASLVDGVAGLRAWEARQAEEARAGRGHYLPNGHPAVVDHRWQSTAKPEDWPVGWGDG